LESALSKEKSIDESKIDKSRLKVIQKEHEKEIQDALDFKNSDIKNENSNSDGPPPPPNLDGNDKLPNLPKREPKKPTKNFYCDVITKTKIKNTIWIKAGITEKTNDIKIDFSSLENFFELDFLSGCFQKILENENITFVEEKKGFKYFITM
jgi:hypothetical protein